MHAAVEYNRWCWQHEAVVKAARPCMLKSLPSAFIYCWLFIVWTKFVSYALYWKLQTDCFNSSCQRAHHSIPTLSSMMQKFSIEDLFPILHVHDLLSDIKIIDFICTYLRFDDNYISEYNKVKVEENVKLWMVCYDMQKICHEQWSWNISHSYWYVCEWSSYD